MEQEFRALLTGSAAVIALVPATRIDWGLLGQGKGLPAIRLHLIGNRQGLTQQGRDGLWRGRVQVDCYGASYASAHAAAEAVIGALDLYRGGGFRGIFLDARRPDVTESGAADRPQRIILEFLTNWRAG